MQKVWLGMKKDKDSSVQCFIMPTQASFGHYMRCFSLVFRTFVVSMKKTNIRHIALMAVMAAMAVACASIGSPDGGPFDEDPPVFLGSTPAPLSLGVTGKRVTLEFDEYIKIEKAAEKVVISPPQITQPIIKVSGKNIVVQFEDSLKPATTYSIDFNDAIVDNNEGNPLGNFALSFSTGDQIDTLAVSGTVLNASNLEPIKGILVGLYSDLSDSVFTKKPFERVSRTDADGRFTIRGIAPGSYRAYALQDANQNYMFEFIDISCQRHFFQSSDCILNKNFLFSFSSDSSDFFHILFCFDWFPACRFYYDSSGEQFTVDGFFEELYAAVFVSDVVQGFNFC
jgi:hypothetical protein